LHFVTTISGFTLPMHHCNWHKGHAGINRIINLPIRLGCDQQIDVPQPEEFQDMMAKGQ